MEAISEPATSLFLQRVPAVTKINQKCIKHLNRNRYAKSDAKKMEKASKTEHPGVGLGAPRLPQGDCFARQCTNLAVEVARRRGAPFWPKLHPRASQIRCKIITKIHEQ